ncbi:MAG: hypothetical protein IPM42_16355 [Saprospiraceae bacterium]|nr:hypothetical protein [Saprospiraceae bacterium]
MINIFTIRTNKDHKGGSGLTILCRNVAIAAMMIFFVSQNTFAQATGDSYKTAVGVKFYPTGVTVKSFMGSNLAFEAIGYFWERGTRITGLFEYHYNLSSSGNLKWYIGPGAHVGFYKPAFYDGGTSVGLDGVLGLDYKFPGIPINISLDWQPSFEFGDYAGFSGNWGGIGLRLAF